MKRKRCTIAAVVLSAAAIAMPASSASAASTAPAPGFPVAGWDGLAGAGWGFPILGQAAIVVGPAIITTAPSSFINTNNQVTAGGAVSGGQVTAVP